MDSDISEENEEPTDQLEDDKSLYIGDVADELLHNIKQLVHNATCVQDKIKFLTMTPRSWSIRDLERNFNVSSRMTRKAKELQQDRKFRSSPDPRPSRNLESTCRF